MQLDELTWTLSDLGCPYSTKRRVKTRVGKWEIYCNADGSGQYGIYTNSRSGEQYQNLDAITAQAVLFHLLRE